jgi:hypothetical protein
VLQPQRAFQQDKWPELRQLRSSRLIAVGASTLVMVVCLLSFGEMARRGHYHLDGARGWDLPSPVSLKAAQSPLYSVRLPQVVAKVVQQLFCTERVLAFLIPPHVLPDTTWVWFGLRPPPEG